MTAGPTETVAHEFYSLCRERDGKLTADEVRYWHDRILTLETDRTDLRERLDNVIACGHNDDCLFCARKDTAAGLRLSASPPPENTT